MTNHKEMKNAYKQALTPMGIICIRNKANGKIFIARSMNMPGRINREQFGLKYNSNPVRELQADWNSYGEENFSFEILDTLEPREDPGYNYAEDLEVLETMWLEKLQPYGEKGYNKK